MKEYEKYAGEVKELMVDFADATVYDGDCEWYNSDDVLDESCTQLAIIHIQGQIDAIKEVGTQVDKCINKVDMYKKAIEYLKQKI